MDSPLLVPSAGVKFRMGACKGDCLVVGPAQILFYQVLPDGSLRWLYQLTFQTAEFPTSHIEEYIHFF